MRLLWWMATVAAVSLVSIVLSQAGAIDPAQNLTLTVSAPVEGVLRGAARPVDDIYAGIADRGDLVRENQELRAQVEALQAQLAEQQSAQVRVTELESALGITESRPEDRLQIASVIAEDPSSLKRMIAIDRGLGDGIDEGMVVLSENGSLIGTVARSFDSYAWIRLITDPESTVNAQVNAGTTQPGNGGTDGVLTPGDAPEGDTASPTPNPSATPAVSTVRGVATGELDDDVLFDLLPPDAAILEGSLVVTSGLGANYPPGLLIGTVKDVEVRPQSAFKKAQIEPAATLSSLETVMVLVSFKPERLQSE